MNEFNKTKRKFLIITVWILFVLFTFYGTATAYERTVYVSNKQETEKIYLTEIPFPFIQHS